MRGALKQILFQGFVRSLKNIYNFLHLQGRLQERAEKQEQVSVFIEQFWKLKILSLILYLIFDFSYYSRKNYLDFLY